MPSPFQRLSGQGGFRWVGGRLSRAVLQNLTPRSESTLEVDRPVIAQHRAASIWLPPPVVGRLRKTVFDSRQSTNLDRFRKLVC